MQRATHHLLDGIVNPTCVDQTIHPSISAAPLAVSIITEQCLYACHAASASHALLKEGGSWFWHIMRHVAQLREHHTAMHTLPPTPLIPSRRMEAHMKSESCSGAEEQHQQKLGVSLTPRNAPCLTPLSYSPLKQREMLSPLEFRVVVVGGGRVGRSIVGRLLRAPELIHPSRITIITRQLENVAQFAGHGVQCVGRRDGRQALLQCHILIVACQQTQFYDFAKTYRPRLAFTSAPVEGRAKCDDQQNGMGKKRHTGRQKKRTLKDVVAKWRTADDENGEFNAAATDLLRPGTFIFSCCVALGRHKIAKELGHLDPLVIRADVDLSAVHPAAQEFCDMKEKIRSDFIKQVALEGNSFLLTLNLLQQGSIKGDTLPAELLGGNVNGDTLLFDHAIHSTNHSSSRHMLQPDIKKTLSGKGVSGSTTFIMQIWRALRCFLVVRVASLSAAEHRLFTYLQRVGPMLASILVMLPESSRERIVETLIMELLSYEDGDDVDDTVFENDMKPRRLIKVDQRIVSACDSDDSYSDEGDRDASPVSEELGGLIACFPKLFVDTEDVLQQLRKHYVTVTGD